MATTNDTSNSSVPDLDAPTILAALDVSELAYGTYGPNGTAIDLYGDGLCRSPLLDGAVRECAA